MQHDIILLGLGLGNFVVIKEENHFHCWLETRMCVVPFQKLHLHNLELLVPGTSFKVTKILLHPIVVSVLTTF